MEKMARSRFSVIEQDEAQRIHEASLRVLGDIGIKVNSERALKVLSMGGAETDMRSHVAKIPEHLVTEAIRLTDKAFILASRDGSRDILVPNADVPAICTDGFAAEIIDAVSSQRRKSTNEDLVRFARLGDRLVGLDFFWPAVHPTDHPPHVQMLRGFVTSLENTRKHIQHEALGSRTAKLQIRAASIVAGGEKELEKRPIFSAVQCPVAPLVFERDSIEAAMEFAKAGVPVVYMSMPMAGGSAPITLAGSIVQGHAEVLGGLVISQLVKKGARVFHCILTGPIDMKTGVWASGSPENAIGNAASVQLARHIGIPAMGGGFGTTSKAPDLQAGYEKIATMIPSALAGADIITGIGGLDDAKCMSMIQAVIDEEMWGFVSRMRRGIRTKEEDLGMASIREVNHGGLFLTTRETISKFRSELWLPSLGQRASAAERVRSDFLTVPEAARKKALNLSGMEPEVPLEPDVMKELEATVITELKAA